jgi:hypothetical protein
MVHAVLLPGKRKHGLFIYFPALAITKQDSCPRLFSAIEG